MPATGCRVYLTFDEKIWIDVQQILLDYIMDGKLGYDDLDWKAKDAYCKWSVGVIGKYFSASPRI